MTKKSFLSILSSLIIIFACTACASQKGSSSLNTTSSPSHTTAPRIKSDEQLKAQAQAIENASLETKRKAEADAKAFADKLSQQASEELNNTKKLVAEEANEIQQSAKQIADDTQSKIEDKTITVREESVKLIESEGNEEITGKYHIIIGTFKILENARNLVKQALKNGFNGSILENEEGLYRVSIFSCELDKTARNKITEIRSRYPEYIGTWLLIEKK